VRRLIALLVLSLVGAAVFGLSNASSGIHVNGAAVSGVAFRSELAAIATDRSIQCYLTAIDPVNFAPGAGGASLSATGAAAWSNLRLEGMAISDFVRTQFHYRPDAAALAVATNSLEGELTQAATNRQYNCGASSTQALAQMPAEMRDAEVRAQAASLYLVSKLNATIPLTAASIKAYFQSHQGAYATLCVSVAIVTPARVAAFQRAQASGAPVAVLAKQFSVDRSAAVGGTYGCYGPTSSAYASVRADVATGTINKFPTTPLSISSNGSTYALYVALTKRIATPFARAGAAVLTDIQNLNATSANTVKGTILRRAAIVVEPAFGRWGLGASGPSLFAPAIPATLDVANVATLTKTGASSYK